MCWFWSIHNLKSIVWIWFTSSVHHHWPISRSPRVRVTAGFLHRFHSVHATRSSFLRSSLQRGICLNETCKNVSLPANFSRVSLPVNLSLLILECSTLRPFPLLKHILFQDYLSFRGDRNNWKLLHLLLFRCWKNHDRFFELTVRTCWKYYRNWCAYR